jgi:hypothetical protein
VHRPTTRRTVSHETYERGLLCSFKGEIKRFPWLAEAEANLPVHVVVMKLNPISDDAIYVPRFGGKNNGFLELDAES